MPSFLKISSVISQWFNLPLPLSPVFGFLIFHLPVPINTFSWLTKLKICSSKVAVTDLVPSKVISISLDVSVVDPDHEVNKDPDVGFAFNLITVPALYSSPFLDELITVWLTCPEPITPTFKTYFILSKFAVILVFE